jgi:hypothetical protein
VNARGRSTLLARRQHTSTPNLTCVQYVNAEFSSHWHEPGLYRDQIHESMQTGTDNDVAAAREGLELLEVLLATSANVTTDTGGGGVLVD